MSAELSMNINKLMWWWKTIPY